MEIKTSKLIGDALDWAVQAAQYDYPLDEVWEYRNDAFKPSTNWAQGGPIIEYEKISVSHSIEGDWMGYYTIDFDMRDVSRGPTPLIAALRCLVCSKLGDEVEIPEGLL